MVCDREWKVPPELDAGYATTFSRLRGLYRSRGLTVEDSSDLAQEAIARALLHLRRHGCKDEPVTPLVNRIAGNLLVDHLRSLRARVVSLEDQRIDLDAEGADPVEQLARRAMTSEVRAAIAALPQRHRRAISLSLDGRTPAEIADVLGIRRNAADALLFRARRGLAQLLRAAGATLGALVMGARLRVRASGRRLADGMPAVLVSANATMGLMGAVLATALACGAPAAAVEAAAGPAPARASMPVAAVVSAATARTPRLTPALRDAHRMPRHSEASVDIRDHRIDLTSPGPEPDDRSLVAVHIWHERDPDDRGVTGPLLDQTTATTCSAIADRCDAAIGGTQ